VRLEQHRPKGVMDYRYGLHLQDGPCKATPGLEDLLIGFGFTSSGARGRGDSTPRPTH